MQIALKLGVPVEMDRVIWLDRLDCWCWSRIHISNVNVANFWPTL